MISYVRNVRNVRKLERQVPEEFTADGRHACDVCGPAVPAAVVRPATANRELAWYCEVCARQLLGWGDGYHRI
jgi:hypothetical protein